MVSKAAKRPRAKKQVPKNNASPEALVTIDDVVSVHGAAWPIPGYLMEMVPDPAPAPEGCPACGGKGFIERAYGLLQIACVECTKPRHLGCPMTAYLEARDRGAEVFPALAPGEITEENVEATAAAMMAQVEEGVTHG